jgi:hypothetical protein
MLEARLSRGRLRQLKEANRGALLKSVSLSDYEGSRSRKRRRAAKGRKALRHVGELTSFRSTSR